MSVPPTAWAKMLGGHQHPMVPSGGPEVDAFSRLRMSEPHTLFSAAQLYDNLPLLYETAISGTGSAAHSTALAETAMAVTGAGVGSSVRQSKLYLPYRTANSQAAFFTFVLGTCAAGVKKRVGLFDDANGIFLEQDNAGVRFVIRSSATGSPVDTTYEQINWNLDTLDGSDDATNPTGILFDPTVTQIFAIDFQWLGVGRVRFGFDISGEIVPVHTVSHANDVLTRVYMSTPNLPVRYEITNSDVGGGTYNAGSLKQICAAVVREGAPDDPGYQAACFSGAAMTAPNGSFSTVLGVRLKSSHIRARLSAEAVELLNTASVPVRWMLHLNPTTTGSFAGWATTHGANLASVFATTTLPVTANGTVLAAGFAVAGAAAGGARSGAGGAGGLGAALDVAASIAGTSDILVLSAAGVGGTAAVWGSMSWREIY